MLSYAEATDGIYTIISRLGFKLFTGESDRKTSILLLRKQVMNYYSRLSKENKLDVLHAYQAKDRAELIETVIFQMMERVEEGG